MSEINAYGVPLFRAFEKTVTTAIRAVASQDGKGGDEQNGWVIRSKLGAVVQLRRKDEKEEILKRCK
jgi:hypothetical protein